MILTAIQLTSLKKILTTVSEWLIYQSFAQQYAQINFFLLAKGNFFSYRSNDGTCLL